MHMQELCEIGAGMIFVPSEDVISHNPKEFTDIDDIIKGIRLLFESTNIIASQQKVPFKVA